MVLKRPSIASPGRARSCDNVDGLVDALKPWVTDQNFVTYTTERSIKKKDKEKLKLYLDHLRRIQSVDRTWNFSLKSIEAALVTLNQDWVFLKLGPIFFQTRPITGY